MKQLVLCSAVLLLCASVSQAHPQYGYTAIYNFDDLTAGQNLNGQDPNTPVTWVAVANAGLGFTVSADPNDANDKHAESKSSSQEQLYGTLSNYPTTTTILGLDSNDTNLLVSFVGKMNVLQNALVGVWVDGIDPNNPNAGPTTNLELVSQFGVSSSKWRIRGPNGTPSVNTSNLNLAAQGSIAEYKVMLYMDLNGDGSMTLSVEDLTNSPGTQFTPAGYDHIAMGLSTKDPNYADPSKWTSWWIRSQASGSFDPNYPMTLDDFTIQVIPEPATLTLLVLGGLALIRRRR